jgi:hypothetical protein
MLDSMEKNDSRDDFEVFASKVVEEIRELLVQLKQRSARGLEAPVPRV